MTEKRQTASHFCAIGAKLGEGAVWDTERACLWCVDIEAPAIHSISPEATEVRTWKAPTKVGWILPIPGGGLLAGLTDGIYGFDSRLGTFDMVQAVEAELPGNRLNDATLGMDGSVWFGTMDDEEARSTGRFYRYDGTLSSCAAPTAVITNGPAVSPDGGTLYTVDTLAREIAAYTVAPDGSLSARRQFARVAESDGYPDGVTCDGQGGVWLALWGGWSARRYDPDGCITNVVRFPVANVTKIALGGCDGRTAFATTARKGLDFEAARRQPMAGDLFTFPVEIGA